MGTTAVPDYLFNLFLPLWVYSLSIFWSQEHSCIAESRVAETRTMALNDSGGQDWYNICILWPQCLIDPRLPYISAYEMGTC